LIYWQDYWSALLKKILSSYLTLFLIAFAIVLLDQLAKVWVKQNLALNEVFQPEIALSQLLRIVHTKNTGAVLGIFQNFSVVFTIIPVVFIALILIFFPRIPQRDWMIRLAMGLYLGGAIGNLIDRLTVGYVIDFISIGRLPIFNIADLSITLGMMLFIFGVLDQEESKKNKSSLC
jgi:signal peptidase II